MSGKRSLCKLNTTTDIREAENVNPRHAQRKGCTMRTCDLISPVKYLKHVAAKVAAVAARVTTRASPPLKSSRRRDTTHPPPRTSVAPIDSQRAEAIHDCIDFINSSSSLPRSNSVAR